jgi:hypothetical protein
MPKYLVEGNIDFYGELYKSLDKTQNEASDSLDEISNCLITNDPLTENHVVLQCGHKFNYVPLYKDLVNRKTKLASLDTQNLKVNEIRCPYCREKDAKLLPYYEHIGVEKFHGVNYIDETKNSIILNSGDDYFMGSCCYKFINGLSQEVQCPQYYVTKHDDGKDYCYTHLRVIKRKLIKEKLLEKKAAEKAAKLAEKAEIKNQIALEKQKVKEEKQKAKVEIQKTKQKTFKKQTGLNLETGENVVINVAINVCKQVLKSGPRKGEMCGCKGKVCIEGTNDYYCARHAPNTNST